jgi:hypothetical protein
VPATPSIKVVKQMNYKDVPKLWSNRYHFNGGTPADGTHWTTFSDAVVAAEKAIYKARSDFTIVHTYGYAAGSDVPVFSKAYTQVGTLAGSGNGITPGDVAALIRYATTARTSKNHPIYLFNYYHLALWDTSTTYDKLDPVQLAAMNTYATAWITGFSDGSLTLVRAGPNGATATSRLTETYLTHRDFRH